MTPPGFEFHMLKSHGQESVMRCDFINGYKRVYYLGMTPFSIIMEDIKLLNEAIELQRSLAGNEDVLDEETMQGGAGGGEK